MKGAFIGCKVFDLHSIRRLDAGFGEVEHRNRNKEEKREMTKGRDRAW